MDDYIKATADEIDGVREYIQQQKAKGENIYIETNTADGFNPQLLETNTKGHYDTHFIFTLCNSSVESLSRIKTKHAYDDMIIYTLKIRENYHQTNDCLKFFNYKSVTQVDLYCLSGDKPQLHL